MSVRFVRVNLWSTIIVASALWIAVAEARTVKTRPAETRPTIEIRPPTETRSVEIRPTSSTQRFQHQPSKPSVRFMKQPANVNIDQYSRMRLRCRLQDLEPNHIVVWTKNNRTISRGLKLTGEHPTVDGQRYSVMGGHAKGYYDLRIWDVTRLDTGNYSCSVYEREDALPNGTVTGKLLIQSRSARVTVYYLPPASYPKCPLDTRYRDVHIGETIPVCHSQKGYPPITLELENLKDTDRVKVDAEGASDYIFVTLNVTEADHGQTYDCKATSTEYPYYHSRCRVGPINVVFEPRVVIRPLRYAIHEGEEAVFVCDAESSPEPSLVQWTVYPPIAEGRVQLHDDNRTLRIVDIRNSDDGRLMSCTVENTQGNDTAHRILAIRQTVGSRLPDLTKNKQGPSTVVPGRPEQTAETELPGRPNSLARPNLPAGTGLPRRPDAPFHLEPLPIPRCSEFSDRVLVPVLVGIIVLLLVAMVALLVRSRLWIFPKRLDEHSAQTELMRPLTEYEIHPAVLAVDNKQLMLNVT